MQRLPFECVPPKQQLPSEHPTRVGLCTQEALAMSMKGNRLTLLLTPGLDVLPGLDVICIVVIQPIHQKACIDRHLLVTGPQHAWPFIVAVTVAISSITCLHHSISVLLQGSFPQEAMEFSGSFLTQGCAATFQDGNVGAESPLGPLKAFNVTVGLMALLEGLASTCAGSSASPHPDPFLHGACFVDPVGSGPLKFMT